MANLVLCIKHGNRVHDGLVGNTSCVFKMKKNDGRNGEFDLELCDEV